MQNINLLKNVDKNVLALVALVAVALIFGNFSNVGIQGRQVASVCAKGDANLDGAVDVKGDLPVFLDLAFPTSTSVQPQNTCCADVNKDGKADISDYNAFLAKIQSGEKLEFEGTC